MLRNNSFAFFLISSYGEAPDEILDKASCWRQLCVCCLISSNREVSCLPYQFVSYLVEQKGLQLTSWFTYWENILPMDISPRGFGCLSYEPIQYSTTNLLISATDFGWELLPPDSICFLNWFRIPSTSVSCSLSKTTEVAVINHSRCTYSQRSIVRSGRK